MGRLHNIEKMAPKKLKVGKPLKKTPKPPKSPKSPKTIQKVNRVKGKVEVGQTKKLDQPQKKVTAKVGVLSVKGKGKKLPKKSKKTEVKAGEANGKEVTTEVGVQSAAKGKAKKRRAKKSKKVKTENGQAGKKANKKGKAKKKQSMKMINDVNEKEDTGAILFISHLPHGFYANEIKSFFKQFGNIEKVSVPRSEKTGERKGYAYVKFTDIEIAAIAAQTMDNYLMKGKVLKCELMPSTFVNEEKFFPPVYTAATCPRALRRKEMIGQMNRSLNKAERKLAEEKMKKFYTRKLRQLEKQGVIIHLPGLPVSKEASLELEIQKNLKTLRKTYDELWESEELLCSVTALESILLALKERGVPIKSEVPHPLIVEIREQMETKLKAWEEVINSQRKEEKAQEEGEEEKEKESEQKEELNMDALLDEMEATLVQKDNQVKFQEALDYYTDLCKKNKIKPQEVIARITAEKKLEREKKAEEEQALKKKQEEEAVSKTKVKKVKEGSKKVEEEVQEAVESDGDDHLVVEVDESDDEIQIKTPPNVVKKYVKITPSSPARKNRTPPTSVDGKVSSGEQSLMKTLFKKKGLPATPDHSDKPRKIETPQTVKITPQSKKMKTKGQTPQNNEEKTAGKRKADDELQENNSPKKAKATTPAVADTANEKVKSAKKAKTPIAETPNNTTPADKKTPKRKATEDPLARELFKDTETTDKTPLKKQKTPSRGTEEPIEKTATPTKTPLKGKKTPSKQNTEEQVKKTPAKTPLKGKMTPSKQNDEEQVEQAKKTPAKTPLKGKKTPSKLNNEEQVEQVKKTPSKTPLKGNKTPSKQNNEEKIVKTPAKTPLKGKKTPSKQNMEEQIEQIQKTPKTPKQKKLSADTPKSTPKLTKTIIDDTQSTPSANEAKITRTPKTPKTPKQKAVTDGQTPKSAKRKQGTSEEPATVKPTPKKTPRKTPMRGAKSPA